MVALFVHPRPADLDVEERMTTPSSGPSGFDDPQVNLGGADAVEKTSYVTGKGTEPEARHAHSGALPAIGGGLGALGWVLIAVAAAIVVYFGLMFLR
jgi:hypothetical protein